MEVNDHSVVIEPAITPVIAMHDVEKRYGNAQSEPVLHHTNFQVYQGDFIAIVGESGSGKSTLLHILGLLDSISSGHFQFDGTDVTHMSTNESASLRASRIGFVFQSFQLLKARTVLDNVALAGLYNGIPARERKQKALRALERMGIAHKANRPASDLSGGEQQRVAIARAIAHEPRLILCDEPTGNLDSQRATSIMELFAQLHNSGMTIVMVTHNDAHTAYASRVFRITDGYMEEVTGQ